MRVFRQISTRNVCAPLQCEARVDCVPGAVRENDEESTANWGTCSERPQEIFVKLCKSEVRFETSDRLRSIRIKKGTNSQDRGRVARARKFSALSSLYHV